MKTDPVNGTVYECPYCGNPMLENRSHFVEHKRVTLYCNACKYTVFGNDPKDAYNSTMRKDDVE